MKTDDSTTSQEKPRKKMLKFTCSNCGGHRLEEVVLMRQDIEGVYDPEDPEYDWDDDDDGMVVITRTVYAVPSEANFYRCYDCEASLTDEDGYEFWEAECLYKWLLANQDIEGTSEEDDE